MIREMRREDMKRVEDIWLEDSIRLHNFFPGAEEFWRQRLPYFRDETSRSRGLVCEAAGSVNGFMTMKQNEAYIHSLYVDFHLRGQGVGSALLDEAKRLSDSLHLHVYQKDLDAVCFYLRQHFVVRSEGNTPEEGTGQLKYYMQWERNAKPDIH